MLATVRYSQIIGLIAVDSSTSSHLGEIEEVWFDRAGNIAYLSGSVGYFPLEQVSGVGTRAISTYGRFVVDAPIDLYRLHRQLVYSAGGEPVGWIEDFLFDWHTGKIVAYILAGKIAEELGGRAVLIPQEVRERSSEKVVMQEGAKERLKAESEGLKGFLSEKSQQVRHLVKEIADLLHHQIEPDEKPEVVRIKVKEASDELASAGESDLHALQEATEFLHAQWESLQQSINSAGSRAKAAFDSAWQHLTSKTAKEKNHA